MAKTTSTFKEPSSKVYMGYLEVYVDSMSRVAYWTDTPQWTWFGNALQCNEWVMLQLGIGTLQ